MKKLFLVLLAVLVFPAPAGADGKQQQRLDFINKLAQHQIITAVRPSGPTTARAVTGPRFQSLPFDDKQRFLAVVASYFAAENPRRNFLVIIDGRTNKKIGTFDRTGLDLD